LFFYDALGRRVAKTITASPWVASLVGATGTERTLGAATTYNQTFSYLVNQDKILLGTSGDGVQTLYLDGQGIDEHLGEVSSRITQAYVTDHLGSVINSAMASAFRTYGAFGETEVKGVIVPTSYIADPVLYGFAGRQFDLESAKYYNRARTYDPSTGRFMSQDPLGLIGGDTNLYRYAGNNPLNFVDPTGRSFLSTIAAGALTATVLGASSTVILLAAAGAGATYLAASYFGGPQAVAVVNGVASGLIGGSAGIALGGLLGAGFALQAALGAGGVVVGGLLDAVTGFPSTEPNQADSDPGTDPNQTSQGQQACGAN
jgi:RHS repeat-associated protein